jgi:hypothetical protein
MRRLVTLLVLAVALAGALVVAPSQTKPAEARVYGTSQALQQARAYMGIYDIAIHKACQQQRGATYGQPWDFNNPYSWFCLRVTSWWPYRVVYAGDLDLNRYCRENHPGTRAVLNEHVPVIPAFRWSCVRYGASGGW